MALKSKVAIEVDIKNVKKITELKDSLKQLRKEQRQYEKDVKGGVKVTKESANAYIKNEKAIAKNSKALRETNKEVKGVTKSSNGMAKQIVKGTAVIGLAVGAFRTITNVMGTAVKGFRDFEFQMAKVQAITGATNEEFLLLSQSAKDLGRSTFFTAQQVAELQTNFGKLGFTTQEILDAQEATLNLATATDSDLARAAIVAGSAVRGFGLDASETQRVVDVMAVSFTSSALDLEKFQTAMTKVAPIAKSAGFSIEDTTAIMAQLSDAGIEASIAGTSLRNILLKMQNPNSDLVQSFGKTIHSLDELVPALTKFSEEGGSLAEIMEVVDDRQAAAFEQMITSRDKTVQLRDALEGANGAAEEMARIVGDTLEGALKRSESATQGFAIAFVESFGKNIKNIVDGFASFVNTLTDFIEIPVSEKLEEERTEMNLLFGVLKDTNNSQETRQKAMIKLNTTYGSYLPNLVTEKNTVEELEVAQFNANKQLVEKIRLMGATEALNKITEEGVEISNKEFEVAQRCNYNGGWYADAN
jgi:TP901 family phage tail tape measure protein